MTKLLEKAFKECQMLLMHLQDEIVQQLLEDIHNELKWQETLANPNMDFRHISINGSSNLKFYKLPC